MITIKELHKSTFQFLNGEYEKDNTFLFTMSSKPEKIKRGLYLDGTGESLHFTCWGSSDMIERKPSVYVTINTEGVMTLNFVANSPAWKREYFDKLAKRVGLMPGKKSDEGDNFFWRKHYTNKGNSLGINEIIEVLEYQFIADYHTINEFAKTQNIPNFLPHRENINTFKHLRNDILGAINNTTPQTESLSNIKDTTIRLQSLKFENIGIFTNASVDFSKQLTCIIGLNGTGKTTFLRAAVLGLVGFEIGFENNKIVGKNDVALEKIRNMLKIKGVNGGNKGRTIFVENAQIQLNYTIGNISKSNTVLFACEQGEQEPTISDGDSDFGATEGSAMKSLVLAFPQIQGKKEYVKEKNSDPNIKDIIALLDNQPDYRFLKFKEWIRTLQERINHQKVNYLPFEHEQKVMDLVFEIITKTTGKQVVLQGVYPGHASGTPAVWVTIGNSKHQSPIDIDLVSTGFENIFGWIGYMMSRLYYNTPENGDITQTPAVVLIDEIDTYLHPQWQSTIMPVLLDSFPKVQFIITTHSPYVVGSVPPERDANGEFVLDDNGNVKHSIKIYTCEENEEGEVDVTEFKGFTPYGADIGRLSERLFGANSRNGSSALFTNARNAIMQGNTDEASRILAELSVYIPESDPELGSLKMLLETRKRILSSV